MKKLRILPLLLAILYLFTIPATAAPFEGDAVPISSPHALLMDLSSGLVLYEKAADAKVYPASTTKIMTAIVALGANPNFDEVITVSTSAVAAVPVGSSHMGLNAGETMTFRDLIYGMLVYSANDASNVIAEHISGSIDEFVKKMNETAKTLGAEDTHFVSTHGFHDENHYTTARDMATISRFAMTDPTISPLFREIVATKTYTIGPTNKYDEDRIMHNTNLLFENKRDKRYIYPNIIGVKTGYTSEAGNCLVSALSRDGQELLCVVMGSGIEDGLTMSYVDTAALYDFAKKQFNKQTVVNTGDSLAESPIKNAFGSRYILLNAKDGLSVTLPINYDETLLTSETTVNENIKAPVKEGQELGKIEYFYDGESLGSIPLVADKAYRLNPLLFLLNGLISILTSPFFFVPVLILLIVIASIREKRRRRVQRQRMERRRKMQEENDRKMRESQREFEMSIRWDDKE